jgi:hypothetical protein
MKRSLIASGLFLSLLLACGAPTKVSSKVANVPGEEPSFGILPGQGFNSIDGTVKGNCVKLGEMTTQSGNATGNSAEFKLLEVTSESSLREALNVSASVSFGGLVGRGSGRMNYASSVNKNAQSRYLLVHTRVANQLEIAKSFEFSDTAKSLLKLGRQADFLRNCGNEFAYGRKTGGEFFALFEFDFVSSQEEKSFSAAISAAAGAWKGSAAINSELAKFNMNARTQVKMFRVGGTGGLPEVDDIADFGRKFSNIVASVGGSPVTLEILTKNYDGVEPLNLVTNRALTTRQEYVINTLAKNRDAAQEIANSLRAVIASPKRYEVVDSVRISEWETSIAKYLNIQNDAAVNCFEDILSGCKVPEIPFPLVTLPAKSNTACQIVPKHVCVLPGNDGQCLAYKKVQDIVCQ